MEVKDYSENYGEGWIKLYRSTKYKGWYKKSEYVHLWVHILLKANHKPNEWIYKNETFMVNPGQFITSRKSLAKETSINPSKVERILKHFEIEQQIEQQNLFSSRLITIINWNDYQKSEQQIEQPVNSERTASEQPVNTNKNVKNDKNEKNVKKNRRFTPPKPNEVEEYAKSIDFDIDGEHFCAYYGSRNWMLSKGVKMSNWKQAVVTWKKNRQSNDDWIEKHKPGATLK